MTEQQDKLLHPSNPNSESGAGDGSKNTSAVLKEVNSDEEQEHGTNKKSRLVKQDSQ
jgi:hypothetical protein